MNSTIVKSLISIIVLNSLVFGATDVYLKLTGQGPQLNVGLLPVNCQYGDEELARKVYAILRYDLNFTRMFNLQESTATFRGLLDLVNWQNSNLDILLVPALEKNRVSTTIIDIASQQIIAEISQPFFRPGDWRRNVHQLSNNLIKKLTGRDGIATSQIVFSNDSGGSKEIYLIDYDGQNLRRLTNNGSINILPRYWPKKQRIIFTTYRYGNPDLYSVKLDGSDFTALSTRQGLNSAAAIDRSGEKILLTISKGQYPNIYLLDPAGNIQRRLTFEPAVDTSPSFAPNGQEFVFISDRWGNPSLYIMDIAGTNIRRLPVNGYCDSPNWSGDGRFIAFSHRPARQNFFQIAVYDLLKNKLFTITDEGNNGNPSFSPDSRFLVFSSNRSGRWQLYILPLTGGSPIRLDIPGNSYSPYWFDCERYD